MTSAALPRHPKCPFCIENGKVKIIDENEFAYLIAVLRPDGTVMDKRHFIIPKQHCETMFDLPADWWTQVQELVRRIPGLSSDFNIALNEGGAKSGKRVPHVHFWVIDREDETASNASYELGFAALIEQLNN